MHQNLLSKPISLSIRGTHVRSFKNRKRIVPGHNGKSPWLATRKDVKKWMNTTTESIASQLQCAARTALGETSTAAQRRSWIASLTPRDDARQIIVELVVRNEDVPKGEEGADILIEKIS
jgi:hypothetical protein